MMCKTNLRDSNYCDNVIDNPEAGPRDNTDGHRQPLPGHATDFLSLTRPIYCQHRRHVCLVSLLLLKMGHTSHDWAHNPLETGRDAPVIRSLICPLLFLIRTETVYLKEAVCHITRSFPRQDNVTGDSGFNLNAEVKQTLSEAVAACALANCCASGPCQPELREGFFFF